MPEASCTSSRNAVPTPLAPPRLVVPTRRVTWVPALKLSDSMTSADDGSCPPLPSKANRWMTCLEPSERLMRMTAPGKAYDRVVVT